MASPAAKHFARATGQKLPDNDKPRVVPASDAREAEEEKSENRTASPAKRHFQRHQAQSEASPAGDTYADATQYELMLMQLAEHKRQLKGIQSVAAKIEQKRKFLPDYAAYVEGVLASDAGVQDDVLMTTMVWAIDTGAIAAALQIAEYALRHGLTTPEQYNRDTATLVTEEVAEADDASLDELLEVLGLTAEYDMPDEVRAKLHKAIGLELADVAIPAALEHLNRAKQLHSKVGVAKLIERLEREQRKQQAEAEAQAKADAEAAAAQ